MGAQRICSHCLRSLNRSLSIQHKTLVQARDLRSHLFARELSSSTFRSQDVHQSPPQVHPQRTPAAPNPKIANATSSQQKSPGSASRMRSEISTAEMQKRIRASMGSAKGSNFGRKLAQKLRSAAPSATESYIIYGTTEALVKSCSAQAPYTIPEELRNRILTNKGPPKTSEGEDIGEPEAQSWWFDEMGFQPTFSTWSQVTYLHMYLLTVKLRTMEDKTQYTEYQRYLAEHFSNTAEDKMLLLHNMAARGIRNKYLKDLFIQWRGVLAAYDEGLVKGDAVLAAAVWRNLWKGKEDVDWKKVATVVAYIRKAANSLGPVPLNQLVQNLEYGKDIWNSAKAGIGVLVDNEIATVDRATGDTI